MTAGATAGEAQDRRRAGWIDTVRYGLRLAMEASPKGFLVVLGLAVVSAVAAPIQVIWSKRLLDQIVLAATHGLPTSTLLTTALVLGLLSGLRVVQNVSGNQQAVVARSVTHRTEQRFLGAVADADAEYFDDPAWFDKVSRAGDELDSRPTILVSVLVQLVASAVGLIGLLGVLLSLHPVLVALAIVAALPTLFTQRYVTRVLYSLRGDLVAGQREKAYVADLLSKPFAAKELRAFGLAGYLLARRDATEAPLRTRFGRLVGHTHYAMAAAGLVWVVAYGGAYAFVAVEGKRGVLSIGTLAAVIAAFGQVTTYLGQLVAALGQLDQQSLLFLEDYYALLELPARVHVPATPRELPDRLEDGIEFRDVTFTYPHGNRTALEGVSFTIRPGELLALVGDNGAGKTTLVKLLLRFYLPQHGAVLVGGVDTRDLDPDNLRSRIGVLFQDFVPYEFTARENITLGRVDAPVRADRVDDAVERAQASELIRSLPEGLDNRVGRMFIGGHDLSGGQWQRLALARLLYRDADIWVLDEPTSALDPEAEAAVFSQLRAQLGHRIGIVISHRFSTVRVANRIAVLEGGRVTETGTHEELMALGGRYAHLFELQAAGYR